MPSCVSVLYGWLSSNGGKALNQSSGRSSWGLVMHALHALAATRQVTVRDIGEPLQRDRPLVQVRLARHAAGRLRACCTAGKISARSTPMTVTATSSSSSVNPDFERHD